MNDNEKYIEEFIKDIPFEAPEAEHRDSLKKQLLSAYPKHRLRLAVRTDRAWKIIMYKPIIKLAAAAAIIIAVGVFFFPSDGDILAQVIDRVEKIKTVVYRMKATMKGMPGPSLNETLKIEMQAKLAYDKGFYIDGYTYCGKKKVSARTYVLFDEATLFTVIPKEKKYMKLRLTGDLLERMEKENGDPRTMLEDMKEHEYKNLGIDTIDGVEVEGIEVTDPAMGGGMFDQLVARLWVDVKTKMPVLMTMKASTNDGKVILDMVMDNYQWDVEIDPAELKPNIPDDYELLADAEFGIDSDGKDIVETLKFFAEFTDGRYPSSLSGMSVVKEFSEALTMKLGGRRPSGDPNEREITMIIKLQTIGMTYAMMVEDGNDPAYYGDKVTAQFPHAVLMRWKIADDTYRVIFGDLTVEDVSSELLAELEATPLNLNPYPINPEPADGTVGTDLKGLKLSWMPAAYATKHRVYLGTSAEKLSLLTVVEGSTCDKVPVLRRDTTYYWRVDEVHTDGTVETGDVWSFNTGGLVAWWKLDDGSGTIATDAGNNGLDGVLVGDASWVDGIKAGALAFDGDGDYVDLGKDPAFDITNQITVSAWIKVDAFDRDWQAIVTKGDSAWRLQRNRGNNTLQFACTGLVVPGNRWSNIIGTTDVKDGWWHHVAGTYDGSKLCLYVDGALDVSKEAFGTIRVNDQPVYIGENSEKPNRFWNGLIDDVRIYSYALGADELGGFKAPFQNKKPTAIRPQPDDGAPVAAFADVELTWMPGASVSEHKVYFGTEADQLTLLAEVTDSCSVKAPDLERTTTYYWRVDEVQPDGSIAAGDVWSFDTGRLIGFWKLDGDADDSSGNGNHGTINGDPNHVKGRIDGAMQFDGIDDYIETDLNTDLPTWTVALWIKSPAAPSSSATGGPVHRENNFQINWNHVYEDFRGAAGVRVADDWYAAGFGQLQADQWYHLAATYDGENLKAYKNGLLITDNPDPSGPPNTESATLKFARHANFQNHFEGTIDNIRLYSYDLTADEIAAVTQDPAVLLFK
jgi:outer membrane lipoprotein-sorting protein